MRWRQRGSACTSRSTHVRTVPPRVADPSIPHAPSRHVLHHMDEARPRQCAHAVGQVVCASAHGVGWHLTGLTPCYARRAWPGPDPPGGMAADHDRPGIRSGGATTRPETARIPQHHATRRRSRLAIAPCRLAASCSLPRRRTMCAALQRQDTAATSARLPSWAASRAGARRPASCPHTATPRQQAAGEFVRLRGLGAPCARVQVVPRLGGFREGVPHEVSQAPVGKQPAIAIPALDTRRLRRTSIHARTGKRTRCTALL